MPSIPKEKSIDLKREFGVGDPDLPLEGFDDEICIPWIQPDCGVGHSFEKRLALRSIPEYRSHPNPHLLRAFRAEFRRAR